MPCHLEPQQLSPAVTQNQERKQEIKRQRRHNAHIDGGNRLSKDIFGRARLDDRDRIPISAVLLGLLTVYR
jgi:hypothetical protein